MSNFPQNAAHSDFQRYIVNPDLPNLTELAALAEKLHESVKNLLVFCQHPQQEKSPDVESSSQNAGKDRTGQEKTPCETRCYELPGYILDEERKMLEFYEAGTWQELFSKAYEQLYATVMLMEHLSAEEEFDGFSISLIAGNLMLPLNMLSRLCSLVADFHLVNATEAV